MAQRRGRGRPRQTDQDTSQALSRAALLRFAAQGYEATSLREIAADANVDVALISYRFGGKAGLWKSIVSDAASDLRDALAHALLNAEAETDAERLRYSMKAFLAYLLARPEVPRLLLRDITVDTDRSRWLLDELTTPLHRHFFELAQSAAGSVANPPSHMQFRIANFIYSAASTVARRERLARLVESLADDAAFEEALVTTLIDGVLPGD